MARPALRHLIIAFLAITSQASIKTESIQESPLALDPVEERCGSPIVRDSYGVERTMNPFCLKPLVHNIIMSRLNDPAERKIKSAPQIALGMLARDFQDPITGPPLQRAWDVAGSTNPSFGNLPEWIRNNPVNRAGYVYSLEAPYNTYDTFNRVTSSVPGDSIVKALLYPYKGYYALLTLGLRSFSMDLYRGLDTRFAATPGIYIRFNRFTSASFSRSVAEGWAGKSGTVFIIKGAKMAYHISPVSYFPHEEEYLLPPETQYRVLSNHLVSGRTVITLQVQPYA